MSDNDLLLRRRSKAQHKNNNGAVAVPAAQHHQQQQQARPQRSRSTSTSSYAVESDAETETATTRTGARRTRGDDADAAAASIAFGVLDVVRMLMGVLLLSAALSWFVTGESLVWGWKPWFSSLGAVKSWLRGPIYLTDAELAAYDGSDLTKPIYVGLNGSIYDVTASRQTYGPDGSYSFFSGKDAARAFITACFEEDLTPDLRGVDDMYIPVDAPTDPVLSRGQLKIRREQETRTARKRVVDGIDGWAKVFRGDTGRPYFYVGEIKREEGWLEKLPLRTLCDAAVKSKPTRKTDST